MFIIFDLDGTLANIEHRLHYISKVDETTKLKRKPEWGMFHRACIDDVPISPIIHVFQALKAQGHRLQIWSGRNDSVRGETTHWLDQHHIYPERLLMRFDGDFTPDHQLKEIWLGQSIQAGLRPDLVFDDRSRLVEMWRRNGIQCCQVAQGEF